MEPDVDAALATLRTHLTLSEHGSLWVVVVRSLAAQERIADHLAAHCATAAPVERFRFHDDALSLAARVRALPQDVRGVLLVLDLDRLGTPERRRAVALLNRGREALAERDWDVVLFVSPDTERALITSAGDLWSWRRGVTDATTLFPSDGTAEDLARLRRRYLDAVLERTALYTIPRVFGAARRNDLAFDVCYLPPRALRLVSGDDITPVWIAIEDALADTPRMTIVSEQGSGSSLFLWYLLRRAARIETPLPILVSVRDLPRGTSLPDELVDLIALAFERTGLGSFSSVILDAIERGEALLLLDDLDAIERADARERCAHALNRTLLRHPSLRVVLTRRHRATSTPEPSGFARFEFPHLALADGLLLIERVWGLAAERLRYDLRADPTLRAHLARPERAVSWGYFSLVRNVSLDALENSFAMLREAVGAATSEPAALDALADAALDASLAGSDRIVATTLSAAFARREPTRADEAPTLAHTLLASDDLFTDPDGSTAQWRKNWYRIAALSRALVATPFDATMVHALGAARHESIWQDAFELVTRAHAAPSSIAWPAALRGAPPAPYEDLLHRDLLLRGLVTRVFEVEVHGSPTRAALLALLRTPACRRLPELAYRIAPLLASAAVTTALESLDPRLNAPDIAPLASEADDTLALDGVLLLLFSTRASILTPEHLHRVGAAIGAPRRAVRARAWRCIEQLAVDLDALNELAGRSASDPDARLAVLHAAVHALTERSSESRSDPSWQLGLSLCRSALTDGAPAVRALAARGLACAPDEAPRDETLTDVDETVRRAAVGAWRGRIPDDRLVAMATDPSPAVRASVAGALRAPYRDAAIVALRTLVEDPSPLPRAIALESLTKAIRANPALPDADVLLDVLLDALLDALSLVRTAATRALHAWSLPHATLRARIDHLTTARPWTPVQRVLVALRAGLRDEDTRAAFDAAIDDLDEPHLDALLTELPRVTDAVGDAMLRPWLAHPRAAVRAAAWEAVAGLRDVPGCCEALCDDALADERSVAHAAARALPRALRAVPMRVVDALRTLLARRDDESATLAASLLQRTAISAEHPVGVRLAACDALAEPLRDVAFCCALSDETCAALWTALRDAVAALTDARVLRA